MANSGMTTVISAPLMSQREPAARGARSSGRPGSHKLDLLRLALSDPFCAPELAVSPQAAAGIRKAMRYMALHHESAIYLRQLAALARMGTFEFARKFRYAVGFPPAVFLRRVRAAHAKQLLAETDEALKSVALVVGYADSRAFIRAFKSATGQTPGEYRLQVETDRDGKTREISRSCQLVTLPNP